jgi:hypothetical protein
MNGKKSRLLRRIVYGDETHRQRSYFWDTEHNRTETSFSSGVGRETTVRSGAIMADKKRRIYKHIKKIYTQIRGVSAAELEAISNGLKV